MSHVENYMKWCLKEPRRLTKEKPNLSLAEKHLKKSEYNYIAKFRREGDI